MNADLCATCGGLGYVNACDPRACCDARDPCPACHGPTFREADLRLLSIETWDATDAFLSRALGYSERVTVLRRYAGCAEDDAVTGWRHPQTGRIGVRMGQRVALYAVPSEASR